MPTYDYVCTACGHEVEVVHSLHGHGPSACPKCGGGMKKSFAPPAVHFKGSGWARKERGSGRSAPSSTSSGPSEAPTGGEAGANPGSNSEAPAPKPSAEAD